MTDPSTSIAGTRTGCGTEKTWKSRPMSRIWRNGFSALNRCSVRPAAARPALCYRAVFLESPGLGDSAAHNTKEEPNADTNPKALHCTRGNDVGPRGLRELEQEQ